MAKSEVNREPSPFWELIWGRYSDETREHCKFLGILKVVNLQLVLLEFSLLIAIKLIVDFPDSFF